MDISFGDLMYLQNQLKEAFKLKDVFVSDSSVYYPNYPMRSRFLGVVSAEAFQDLNALHGIDDKTVLSEVIMTSLQDDKEETASWEGKTFIGYTVALSDIYTNDDFIPCRNIILRFAVI